MSGLILMVAIGLWAVVGRWVWRDFVRRHVPEQRARAAGIAFAVAWYVVPVGDEILGAYHFKHLCAEIPPTRYYGPIAVGPGAFFDEQGNPRWKTADEFFAIRRKSNDWDRIWDRRTERTVIARWPMKVIQTRNVYHDKSTGRLVIESYYRGSVGGLLKRFVGGGFTSGYSCYSKGVFPKDEQTIVFAESGKSPIGGKP